ncbi:MAG: hypothetical protein GX597_05350 [Anaerolineaceae bacterium]|nr:hypothetical protein [Anaerolineaceae bacterium]
MDFLTCEVRTLDGQSLGVMVLKAKTFASGSRDYHGQAKIEVEGERLQCQCQAVVIGSKGDAKQEASE